MSDKRKSEIFENDEGLFDEIFDELRQNRTLKRGEMRGMFIHVDIVE